MTIVVAVDGSPASVSPLAEARTLAERERWPLLGIFVLDGGWVDYIGNDWQSSAGSRQGFLDYVERELRQQGELARAQFTNACADLDAANFKLLAGDPCETLVEAVTAAAANLLIIGRQSFHVCGRPSIRTLPARLQRRLGDRVRIV